MNQITTIIRKELKSYLDHPMGYVFLIIFLAINNFFLFKTVLFNNISSIRPMFDLLPWILLFLVPAVTMRMLSEEKKSGTWEILLTLPLKDYQYLLGKWISSVIFITLGLLITITNPLTLAIAGSFDWSGILAQYLGGVILIASLSSLGLFASQITKNQIIAFLTSIILIFFFVIAGADIVTLSLPSLLKNLFTNISITSHYNALTRGVFDIRDLVYFLSFTLIFLSLTYWRLRSSRANHRTKSWKKIQTVTTALVIIAVLINIGGQYIRGRVDFTKNNLYTLSQSSKSVLKKIPSEMKLEVFLSKEIPPELNIIVRDAKDLLQDMANNSNGKISLTYTDPTSDEQASERVKKLNIPPIQFNIVKQDEFQVKQGYFGLSLEYDGQNEVIPYINNTQGLELEIIKRIKKLTTTEKPRIAFISGHGEKNIFTDYKDLKSALDEIYTVEELPLDNKTDNEGSGLITDKKIKEKGTAIDSNITTLVIAGPKQKYATSTREEILSYIQNGGSALFLLDGVIVTPQLLTASANPFSGNSIINPLGVTINQDLILDLRSNESVTFGGGQMNYILPYPFWIRAQANPEHSVTRDLKSIVIPWGSSLTTNDPQDDKKITPLIQTTQFGYAQNEPFLINPQDKVNIDQNNLKNHLLAVSVTLGAASASDQNADSKNTETQQGRAVIVGDSDFLSGQFIQNSPQNITFALNAIDWLTQDESLIQIRSKNRIPDPLVFSTDAQKAAIKYFNTIGIPLLIILAAAIRLYLRRRKIRKTA